MSFAARQEAFLVCAECSASRWAFTSPSLPCPACRAVSAPTNECVSSSGQRYAMYSCCGATRTVCIEPRAVCPECHARAMAPASLGRAVGVTLAWCRSCRRYSAEMNGCIDGDVMCRGCRHNVKAGAICSPTKYMSIRRRIDRFTFRALREATQAAPKPAAPATPANPFELLPPAEAEA